MKTRALTPLLAFLFALLAQPMLAQQTQMVPQSAAQIQLTFAPVVERTAPAVVNIYATYMTEQVSPFANDPFFSEFFRGLTARPQVQNALGSGVIVKGGLVVTNYHVVRRATEIRVVLADRREFDGQVVLADQEADLAIIRLQGADEASLPAIEIGDSDALAVGDLVLAIGNPFGVGQTVSSGIISGLARTGRGANALTTGRYFIQTDAPINPGNSGGALVDMAGRLIGINTLIVTRSGGSVGLGFAIPANLVRQVVAQARAGHDHFVRPWAGLDVQEVDADMAEALGFDRPRGVLVRALAEKSPFADAGLEPGDVLIALGGQPVNAAAELAFRLATQPLGGTVTATWLHDGAQRSAPVALVPRPEGAAAAGVVQIADPGPFQGLTLAPLTSDLTRRLGLSPQVQGVVVVEGPRRIGRTGLAVGDVILAVDGVAVTDPARVASLARGHRGWWRIDLIRGNRRITLRTN